jgi:hypothetical protein
LETDLVDAYVEGTLTREQRQHFETRYLVTLERNAAVQAAYLSKVYRDRVANPLPISARPVPKIWFQWSAGRGQFVSVMAAGLAMVILGGGAWLLFDRGQVKRDVEMVAENHPTAPVAPVQNSEPSKAPVHLESKKSVPTVTPASSSSGAIKGLGGPTGNKTPAQSSNTNALSLSPPVPPNDLASAPAAPSPDVPIPDLSAIPASPTSDTAAVTPAAQDQNSLAEIRRALDARYVLTAVTADRKEIVTPGTVVTLKKSGLIAVDVSSRNLYQNTYQNGRILQKNSLIKAKRVWEKLPAATPAGGAERDFASGEKVWVTGIEIKETGVVFNLLTDAYQDTRYEATLRFPFPNGSIPTVNGVTAMVAQVFDAPESEAEGQRATHASAAAPHSTTSAAGPRVSSGAALAAPWPPQPKTGKSDRAKKISLGQTIEEVVAAMGEPDMILQLATKKIYVYKDMKITFKAGKVTDVQ